MLPPYVETDLNLNQTNYVFSLRRFVFRRLVPIFTKIGLKTPKYFLKSKDQIADVCVRRPSFGSNPGDHQFGSGTVCNTGSTQWTDCLGQFALEGGEAGVLHHVAHHLTVQLMAQSRHLQVQPRRVIIRYLKSPMKPASSSFLPAIELLPPPSPHKPCSFILNFLGLTPVSDHKKNETTDLTMDIYIFPPRCV